jgi:hypothetical protein
VTLFLNALTLVVPACTLAIMARVNNMERALHIHAHVGTKQARLRPPKRVGGREHHITTAGRIVHRLVLLFPGSLASVRRDIRPCS